MILYDEEGCKMTDREASDKIVEHWNAICKKYMKTVYVQEAWAQETIDSYTNYLNSTSPDNMQQQQGTDTYNFPRELREHVDMSFSVNNAINPMGYL